MCKQIQKDAHKKREKTSTEGVKGKVGKVRAHVIDEKFANRRRPEVVKVSEAHALDGVIGLKKREKMDRKEFRNSALSAKCVMAGRK